ncbi:MAG: hypothetical protein ABII27_02875 [bacterium]
MNKILSCCVIIIFSSTSFADFLFASDRDIYFGTMIGSPTGIVGGVKTSEFAHELNLGVSGGDFAVCFSKLYRKPEFKFGFLRWEFPIAFGWGLKYRSSFHPQFALRGILLCSYLLSKSKLELFLQSAPAFRLMPSYGVNIDWTLGVKFKY